MTTENALFKSAHDALVFAFRYAHQQSPHTPMTRLMQGGALGSGKGLVGVEGAGQAGMILAAVFRELSADQRAVIIVRYCAGLRETCPFCSTQHHPKWWMEYVASLATGEGLGDLAKPIREAIVMKTVGRLKLRVADKATNYDVTERSIRRRISAAKDRFAKIENSAMAVLAEQFSVDLVEVL